MSIEAMKQALETLLLHYEHPPINVPVIEELRQAIADAEKREWVGLTDEEKGWCAAPTYAETIERVEAKLKEKNA
jgi:hypothetical protein